MLQWPAAGFENTELAVSMEPKLGHGAVWPRTSLPHPPRERTSAYEMTRTRLRITVMGAKQASTRGVAAGGALFPVNSNQRWVRLCAVAGRPRGQTEHVVEGHAKQWQAVRAFAGRVQIEVVVLMAQARGVYTDRHNKREDLPCGDATC